LSAGCDWTLGSACHILGAVGNLAPGPAAVLRFGPFELDRTAGELRRAGRRLRIQPQPLRLLAHLAENPGRAVGRDELRRVLWDDGTHVDFDRGLNFCVRRVRAALGDDAETPRYVQTVPRRGYRFVAPVEGGSSPAPPRRSFPRLRVAALLAVAALASWTAVSSGNRDPERVILAVLPFESGPEAESLAEGLGEELNTALGRLAPGRLGVIARTSVRRYPSPRDLADVRRELGVELAVEGSVRREGSRTRVDARLVRTSDGSQLWSERVDGEFGGDLALVEEVTRRVADALARELVPGPEGLPAGPRLGAAPEDLHTARALLLRGDPDSLSRARALLGALVEREPREPRAWAALADVEHRLRFATGSGSLDGVRRGHAAARRAIELEPRLADGHHMLGLIELWHGWDPARAGESLERALQLDAASARAQHDDAWHWIARGRPEAAVAAIRRARRLDPVSPEANCDVGWVLLRARRYGEAAAACRRTLLIEPGYPQALACAATAAERLSGDATTHSERVGLREAREVRRLALEERAAEGRPDPYHLALVQAALGRADEAFASLERAFDRRAPLMVMLGSDPELDPLRGDPRYGRLAMRVAQTRPLETSPGPGRQAPEGASSRRSQSLATRQSRFTVGTETPSTAAISSWLSPPK